MYLYIPIDKIAIPFMDEVEGITTMPVSGLLFEYSVRAIANAIRFLVVAARPVSNVVTPCG